MIRLGLTGGIASGKSTVASQFALLGCHLYDADLAVHRLLRQRGPVRRFVEIRFPEVVVEGTIDRKRLGNIVFSDRPALAELESVLHPAVTAWEEREAKRLARSGVCMMLSEIPLLFEVGAESRYDFVVTVSCPAYLQRLRAFRRAGMTEEKYRHILARQWTAAARRVKADAEIFTGLGRAASMVQVQRILAGLQKI